MKTGLLHNCLSKIERMKKTFPALLLCVLLIPTTPSSAQFRKYSNEFLNIGAGARGLSMGGAQVATVSDGTAGYWNPAGLVNVKEHPNLNVMHSEYFAGIGKYDYVGLAVPLNKGRRTLGVSLLRFAVDDIPNTLYLIEPDGNINYTNITSFSAADYALIVSLAQQAKDRGNKKISYGVNAKVIHRTVGKFANAWGFGIDAGIQIVTPKWRFGVMARDLTTTFNAWSFSFTEPEKVVLYRTNNVIPSKSTELTAPRLTIGGASIIKLGKKSKLQIEANLDVTFDGKRNTVLASDPVSVDPKLGLELSVKDVFFVRAGVNNLQQTLDDRDVTNQKKTWIYQPGLGAGFRISNVTIDYAFTNLANQSDPLYTHVFSLKLDLVKTVKKK
jgi:hypothetical protein